MKRPILGTGSLIGIMPNPVLTEQIRILYQNLPLSLFGVGSVASALALLLADTVAYLPLLAWWSIIAILVFLRIYHYINFKQHPLTDDLAALFARQTMVYSAVLGLCWAWVPLYYFQPDNILLISNISLFVIGIVAGSLVTQAVFMPSLWAFLLPISTSSTIAIGVFGGEFSYLAVVSVGYTVIAIVFAHRVHKMFLQVITTRFDNDELLAQLRVEKKQAEDANLAKSKFLASASHDVRQPLHAMALYVGMLKEDPANLDLIGRIEDAMSALEELYSRILEISQLDAGAVDAQEEALDLSQLCGRVSARNGAVADAKSITLQNSVSHPMWVLSDEVLLTRILENLISNALRYTPIGGQVIVSVCIHDADQIVLEVADTGIGIAPQELNNIYQEFYQIGNPARDRTKGIGLGLSIVKRLSEILDHPISVRSELGQGTTFSLRLPSCEPAPSANIVAPDINLNGLNVLVLEDDPDARAATSAQLQQWGCTSQAFADTSSMHLGEQPPDLLIADFRLPGTDGLQACQNIVERYRVTIPTIIITGDTATNVLRQLRDSGFAVLHKPVSSQELRATIQQVLAQALEH